MEKAILGKRRTGRASKYEETCENRNVNPAQSRLLVSVLYRNSCAHDICILQLTFSACCGSHYHIRKIDSNTVASVISKRKLAEWLALSKHVKLLVMRWL